jgi:glucose-6-phosphate 1-epimerase
MKDGQPIRGGIPLAFPQFAGDGPLPNHGFARTSLWTCVEQELGRVVLSLEASAATKLLWPYDFNAWLTVQFDAQTLTTRLRITNTDAQTISFQALQHTYHRLTQPLNDNVQLLGLQEQFYLDKTQDKARKELIEPALLITKETDAIFPKVASPNNTAHVTLKQLSHNTVVTFGATKTSAEGQLLPQPCDMVVWNPWIAKAKAMADFGDDEYVEMVCIEPGCVVDKVELMAGEQFELMQDIKVGVGSKM